MLKELEEKLKSLTDEDKMVLMDLLNPAEQEIKQENIQVASADMEPLMAIRSFLVGRGDGVMSAKAHKALEEAVPTGDSTGDSTQRESSTSGTYNPGKDSQLIEEWRARNKARQDATLQKLLEARKRK